MKMSLAPVEAEQEKKRQDCKYALGLHRLE